MILDKQTLKDLEVFRSDETTTTLFDFIDKTKTAGGSYCLRQKFLNPPGTFDELKTEQAAIRFFSEMADSSSLKLPYASHQIKSLEEYIGSNINVIEDGSLLTCIMYCITDIEAYRYIKGGLKEIVDFVYAFYELLQTKENLTPVLLRRIRDKLAELINDPDFREAALAKNIKIRFWSVLRSDRIFRTRLKNAFQEILGSYYEVDASLMIISGMIRWNTSLFILSSHLWELWEKIKIYNNIKELCFESKIIDEKPVFSYRLLHGVSDMRLGLTIIENEKIMDLLNPTENVKN